MAFPLRSLMVVAAFAFVASALKIDSYLDQDAVDSPWDWEGPVNVYSADAMAG